MRIMIVLLFIGCHNYPMRSAKNTLVFESKELLEHGEQEIGINAFGYSAKDIKNNLKLVKAEDVNLKDSQRLILFLVKKITENNFVVKPKKNLLKGKYIILKCDDGDCKKIYQFTVKNNAPKLVFQDIGQHELPIVKSDRVYFQFGFDQPIFIFYKNNIVLRNDKGETVKIDYSNVLSEKQQVEIRIKESQLVVGQKYTFELSQISNLDGLSSSLRKSFIVGGVAMALSIIKPAQILASSHSIAWNWVLNNAHKTKIFLYNDEQEKNLIVQEEVASTVKKRRVLDEYSSEGVLKNLEPDHVYKIIFWARDNQGKTLKKSFRVKTNGV